MLPLSVFIVIVVAKDRGLMSCEITRRLNSAGDRSLVYVERFWARWAKFLSMRPQEGDELFLGGQLGLRDCFLPDDAFCQDVVCAGKR